MPLPLLQRVIDSKHFQELIAYAKLFGIPDPWQQTGVIASTVANAMAPKKGGGTWKPRDFQPGTYKGPVMKGEDARKSLRSLARAHSRRADDKNHRRYRRV